MRRWPVLLLATIIATPVAAQTKRPSTSRTTKSGVYSNDQAARGKDVYAGYCKSCHSAQTHTGATFNATWNGRPLSELYAFTRERMPKNEPASLSDQEYVDVLAYLLQMNRMPAGRADLPPDSLAMTRIRIQITNATVRKEK